MSLTVDIVKRLGTFDLKIQFEAGNEALALLGGSGSGKSMTLKCVAGIEKPDKGTIIVDGVTLFDSNKHINLAPQKRRVGYLFQQYALFPNMTVRQNIRCGLRDKADESWIIDDIIQKMQLGGLENRRPDQISGGQQQRTALARILVNKPDVLLLDEPFSALDTQLRFNTEMFVKDIISQFGKTVLIVSHDRSEVFRISDHIAVINSGRIETFGRREEVFKNPGTRNSAVMTGVKNISEFEAVGEKRVRAKSWGVEFDLSKDPAGFKYIGIRKYVVNPEPGCDNTFECKAVHSVENPFSYILHLRSVNAGEMGYDSEVFEVEVDKDFWNENAGKTLTIGVPKEEVLLLTE